MRHLLLSRTLPVADHLAGLVGVDEVTVARVDILPGEGVHHVPEHQWVAVPVVGVQYAHHVPGSQS